MVVLKVCLAYYEKDSFYILKRVSVCLHVLGFYSLVSLPKDKNVDKCKFKTLTYDKVNVTNNLKFVLGKIENGYQHFLGFPKRFQNPPSLGLLQSGLCGKELRQNELYKQKFICMSCIENVIKIL